MAGLGGRERMISGPSFGTLGKTGSKETGPCLPHGLRGNVSSSCQTVGLSFESRLIMSSVVFLHTVED